MATWLTGVGDRATDVANGFVAAQRTNFVLAHVVETPAVVAAGLLGRKLVAAAGVAEAIPSCLSLVSVPAALLSDSWAGTADSRLEVAEEGEALEQLIVDHSTFSWVARRARCLEDLGYLTSSVDHEEAMFELTRSQVQSSVAVPRKEETWGALRD